MKKEPMVVVGCLVVSGLLILGGIGVLGAIGYRYLNNQEEASTTTVADGTVADSAKAKPPAVTDEKPVPEVKTNTVILPDMTLVMAPITSPKTDAERVARKALFQMEVALGLMERQKFKESARAYDRFNEAMSRAKGTINGFGKEHWVRGQRQVYAAAAKPYASALRATIDAGKPDYKGIHEFSEVDYHTHEPDKPSLKKRARRVLAREGMRLVMVSISGGDQYEETLKRIYRKKFDASGVKHLKLCFPDELPDFGRNPKITCTVRVEQKDAIYQSGTSRYGIPNKLLVSFGLGRGRLNTTWGGLDSFVVPGKIPESIPTGVDYRELQDRFIKPLAAGLAKMEDKIPVFGVLPRIDANTLSLMGKRGKVDMDAAEKLFLKNPVLFEKRVKELLAANPSDTIKVGLAAAIATNRVESLLDVMKTIIKENKTADFTPLGLALVRNDVTFGEYEPLFLMAQNSAVEYGGSLAFLAEEVNWDPSLFPRIKAIMEDPKNTLRAKYVFTVLKAFEKRSDYREQFTPWILDKEDDFAIEAFGSLSNSYQQTTDLILTYYDHVSDAVKAEMLERIGDFHMYEHKYDPDLLKLHKAAYFHGNRDVRSKARKVFLESLKCPDVWQFCLDARKRMTGKEYDDYAGVIRSLALNAKDKQVGIKLMLDLLKEEHDWIAKKSAEDPKTFYKYVNQRRRRSTVYSLFSMLETDHDRLFESILEFRSSIKENYWFDREVAKQASSLAYSQKYDLSRKPMQDFLKAMASGGDPVAISESAEMVIRLGPKQKGEGRRFADNYLQGLYDKAGKKDSLRRLLKQHVKTK